MHRLRQAIAAIDRARRETEAAAGQVNRLSDVIAEHDRLQAQLRELYARDQTAGGEWIAGGRIGPGPGDAADTRSLNDRIIAMQDELTAHLNSALAVEARIRSAFEALSERAARGDPGMGPAAERIASILRRAQEEAGVPRDNESGRRLLDALATDPGSKLE